MYRSILAIVVVVFTIQAARADIYRWDNGEVIAGTEGFDPGPWMNLHDWNTDAHNLRYADFSATPDLRESRFVDSWLEHSRFNGSDLTSAQFVETALLVSADFTGANLRDADLDGDFTNTNFTGANLSRASIRTVHGAIFDDAIIEEARLATSGGFSKEQLYSTASYRTKNLQGIWLLGSQLTGWNFEDQDLSNAQFGHFFDGSDVTNASFARTNLTGTLWHRAVVSEADFSDAVVVGAYFGGVIGLADEQLYSTASYKQRNLQGIGLTDLDLSGWDFSGQNLTNASLGGTLTDAVFTDANVRGASFSGIAADQLYSTASYKSHDLTGVKLGGHDLTGWDFSGQDLTGGSFGQSTLVNANLTNAKVAGTAFKETTIRGFTQGQLYSTASYAAKNLEKINLETNDLSGWNFSDMNMSNASFQEADLSGANFRGANLQNATFQVATLMNADLQMADVRGASGASLIGASTRNLIRADGSVLGLDLANGETLSVRDYDGYFSQLPIAVGVSDSMSVADGGALRLIFEANEWDSLISFEPAIPVQLGGTLQLTFVDDVDLATQVGRTIRIFDWTGVEPSGAFTITSHYPWDVSQLYTTGEVALLLPGDTNGDQTVDLNDLNNVRNNFGGESLGDTNNDGVVDLIDLNNVRNFFGVTAPQAVPEPSSLALLVLAAVGIVARRMVRR